MLDYDLEGNLIKKQNSTDTSCTQDCTEYVWDANNRLAQLKIKGQTTAVYSYDAQGRRVEASISTVVNGSPQTNTVQYIYEGNCYLLISDRIFYFFSIITKSKNNGVFTTFAS